MAEIEWDAVGDRVFETGVDHGVLYLPDGSAVPWNGLQSINENESSESKPNHFDGRKTNDVVTLGDYSATLTAITFPDELLELEGLGVITNGLYVSDQMPGVFALSYRTKIGNDVNSDAGYKLHIVYNVTAIPSDKEYASIGDEIEPIEFEWEITSVPEDIDGFRPSAHIIIDSRKLAPDILSDIEDMLYGTEEMSPSLIEMSDMLAFMNAEYIFRITDNGDGTWSATTPDPDLITFDPLDPGKFTLEDVDVTYLTPEIYFIKSNYVDAP